MARRKGSKGHLELLAKLQLFKRLLRTQIEARYREIRKTNKAIYLVENNTRLKSFKSLCRRLRINTKIVKSKRLE